MDFFARQESARRHTKLLEVYFALAVIGTIVLIYLAVAVLAAASDSRGHRDLNLMQGSLWNPGLFLIVTAVTLVIIVGASLFKIAQLSGGGRAVAEMLDGRAVDANTSDPHERKLLNVVEEMAIASGTPVPQVYILPGEDGINAFAAGHSSKDAVICATRGAIRLLSRDELQGVIGHEFSHLLNGDMKLNLRLMGLVFGLLCLAIFGRILLQAGDRKNMALPLFGLVLLVVGGIGVFFAKLIKSAVSRQREFLADASSVQFTRNPEGLAGALKKVGGAGSRINDANAEDASHFFFANGLRESFAGMFSTHPPLEERIRALEPAWDGKFISVHYDALDERDEPASAPLPPQQRLEGLIGGRIMGAGRSIPGLNAAVLMQPGAVTAQHLAYAADWQKQLPPGLEDAARDPMSAVALIYALLLSRNEGLSTIQINQLQSRTDPGIVQEAARLRASFTNLESRARLPLASLAMTALRRLSAPQFAQFESNIEFIIQSDQKLELFEYALQKIVLRQLEPNFIPPKRVVIQFYVLKPLVPDAAVLLSALAYAGQDQPAAIEVAFRQGANALGVPGLALLQSGDCGLDKVNVALDRLNQAAAPVKKIVLNACAQTVAADGVIQEAEAELIRAIADTLDCPIPPFVSL